MSYITNIKADEEDILVDIDFTLIKRLDCKNAKNTELYLEKLKRLKEEQFNRIKVPLYTYSVYGTVVLCTVSFIKGSSIHKEAQRRIVYEDVVQHKSNWTFSDFGDSNFIQEETTGTLYAVDLQSYRNYPDKRKREKAWATHIRQSRC